MASEAHGPSPFRRLFEHLRLERNDIWIAIIY
jgi:hypothetical protein